MLLLLVRHAESENNKLLTDIRTERGGEGYAGWANGVKEKYEDSKSNDPAITQRGHEQARKCGAWITRYLAEFPTAPGQPSNTRHRLCCSPMLRARETADHLAGALGAEAVEVMGDIHECSGCWAGRTGGVCGLTPTEIEAQPMRNGATFRMSADAPVRESGWWSTARGKARNRETRAESVARARTVAVRLLGQAASAPGPQVLVLVTHGNFMSLLLQALLGLGFGNNAFRTINTAVTALLLPGEAKGSIPMLLAHNRCTHLDCAPCPLATKRTGQGVRWTGFDTDGRRPHVGSSSKDTLSPEDEVAGAVVAPGPRGSFAVVVLLTGLLLYRGARS